MRRKILLFLVVLMRCFGVLGQDLDTLRTYDIGAVEVPSFYWNGPIVGSLADITELIGCNYGQEPSNYFAKMPSIYSTNDNGTEFGYGYFRIRGLDQSRISVMLDGCPWNEAEDFGAYFANSPDLMSSMESISVNLGSSSLVGGVAGVVGCINLESIDLYGGNSSYAYLGGGSYGGFKGSVVYNMGNDGSNWGLHIKVTHQQSDGYRDYGFNNSQAVTIKMGYKFSNRHSIDILSMNGYHRNGQCWLGCTLDELNLNPRANGCSDLEDDNWFMSMNRLNYRGWVSDRVVLTSSVYYQFQDGSYRMDLDNYMRRMVDNNWSDTGILYDYGLRHNMVGANAMIKGYFGGVTLTFGVNGFGYHREHLSGDNGLNVPIEEKYDNTGYKREFSSFFGVQYDVLNNLSLFGNVQYRRVGFNYEDHLNSDLVFSANDMGTIWDFVNFGLGIEYKPVHSTKLYVKFNRVNREPTRSDMFGGNENFVGELVTITPELANDVEVGINYSLEDSFSAEVNMFYMWFNNELVLNGEYGLNGLPRHENAKESFRSGVEAMLKWDVWNDLNVKGSLSASVNKVNTETYGFKNHIMSPSATFDGDVVWDSDKWLLGLNYNYRSSMYVDMGNEYELPELMTLNLYGGVTMGPVELVARVNNITNRKNYNSGAVGVEGQMLYIQNAGINFNISLKYFF